jgi:glutamate racemase
VDWLDPAEAIARRVVQLIGEADQNTEPGGARIHFTSGAAPAEALKASLEEYGVVSAEEQKEQRADRRERQRND